MNCKVCELMKRLYLLVVTISKYSIYTKLPIQPRLWGTLSLGNCCQKWDWIVRSTGLNNWADDTKSLYPHTMEMERLLVEIRANQVKRMPT
jgi:hypothetical protein